MTAESMSLDAPFRNKADVSAFEAVPLAERIPYDSVYEALSDTAKHHCEKTALITLPPGDPLGEGAALSFADLMAGVNRAANLFRRAGLQKGESVSYLLPLCPQALFTLHGAEAVGTVNAINPLLEPEPILGIAEAAKATILVATGKAVSAELWQKAAYVIERMPNLKAVYLLGGGEECDGKKIFPLDEMLASQEAERILGGAVTGLEDIVGYYHTGGTTGVPKLAPHTNAMQLTQVVSTGYDLAYGERDSVLLGLPLFHISGSIVLGIAPLIAGATVVLVSPQGFRDSLVIGNYWRLVEKYGTTLFGAVPTMLSALLNVPLEGCDISSLRVGFTGGAAAPVEVLKAISEKIGVTVMEGYGMTETTSFVTLQPRDGETRFGSVGIQGPYMAVKPVILDGEGEIERDAEVNEIGVMVMKGPSIMPGYVQEVHNASAFAGDGWLNSGDLGRKDEDGYIWLTGRAKDIIIRSGHNIDPSIIEEALHEHPAVELAAAVGKPDSYAGEIPVAYIQLKPGSEATANELQAFARKRIPERAANPADIHIIDAMPQTAVGKIFKPALRMDAAERVFNRELDDLRAQAEEINLSVSTQKTHGTMVNITVKGGAQGALEEKIKAKLGAYSLHYQITWAASKG